VINKREKEVNMKMKHYYRNAFISYTLLVCVFSAFQVFTKDMSGELFAALNAMNMMLTLMLFAPISFTTGAKRIKDVFNQEKYYALALVTSGGVMLSVNLYQVFDQVMSGHLELNLSGTVFLLVTVSNILTLIPLTFKKHFMKK